MSNWKKQIGTLGPGLITAALIFGPGSLTVTTKLGAGFGYHALWVILLSILLMIAYTKLSAKIGLNIEGSIIKEIKQRYGRFLALALSLGIFAISAAFQAGNSIGAGISLAELFGISHQFWIIIVTLAAIAMLFFQSYYKILEKVMILLVMIMLSCFLFTLILSRPSIVEIAKGFIPSLPNGSELLSIALVASSFSITGAFYQSSLVQEKGWTLSDLPKAEKESQTSIIILGILSMLVLCCSATVFAGKEIQVNTATDLGQALTPLFGEFSTTVFMIGFFAASFSSLIGNALIGGSILADGFGFGNSLADWQVRASIMVVIIAGSVIAYIFGSLPLQLIIFAQAATILVAPAAAIAILLVAFQNGLLQRKQLFSPTNLLLLAGLLVLLFLAIFNFNLLF